MTRGPVIPPRGRGGMARGHHGDDLWSRRGGVCQQEPYSARSREFPDAGSAEEEHRDHGSSALRRNDQNRLLLAAKPALRATVWSGETPYLTRSGQILPTELDDILKVADNGSFWGGKRLI